jgi:predicted ATPase/class 3 adenylate cyclase
MRQIADWLKQLGLSDYAQRFAENDIDFSILPDLTDQHLKDLGVSLGHRLKMLRAIRDLAVDKSVQTLPSSDIDPKSETSAERRQLTVMFCDLVGSTALSARLDPEDLRAIIATYHRCCTELVERNGGFVAKYMGDGVLAYFGYPKATEHDAEQAVRVGLSLVEAVPALRTSAGFPLQVRIGIATGLVVVGDLIGTGASQEQAVVGETPNLAARLQALAEPGAVVIASSTHRLTDGLFDYRDLGPVALKGFAEGVPAWQVLGTSDTESRFEALHVTTTRLIGRDEELDLLMRRWHQAVRGEGCVVLLTGEPGIGKSRLTRALQDRLNTEPCTPLIYHCSPYHLDSALHPISTQLERSAKLKREDSNEIKLAKLEILLSKSSDSLINDVPIFSGLLSVAFEPRYSRPNLTAQQLKARTLSTLIEHLKRLSEEQPVLMLFEDLHWIDPTSLELLIRIVDEAPALRLMVVVTARPEFVPPWPRHRHTSILSLTRLGPSEIEAMVREVSLDKSLPPEVMQQIIARTDGVPLFTEELTKTLLESGKLKDMGDRYELIGPLPPLSIPSTLHASLIARLDRLASVKQVAQIAATIGRDFSYGLIGAVANLPELELQAALARLVGAELIFQRGVLPEASYHFKHAMVQDAAYESILRSHRQQLHTSIAQVIEERFPDTGTIDPGLLAHHWMQAGELERAVFYLAKAGQMSLSRSAMVEATQQFKKGLNALTGIPESVERAKRELELQTGLGIALTANKGYAAGETGQVYTRARQLCKEIGDTQALLRISYGQFLFYLMAGEVRQSHRLANEILDLAERVNSDDARILGRRTLGVSLSQLGQLADARRELEAAAELLGARKRERPGTAASETSIMISTWLSHVQLLQGYFDDAIRNHNIALREANSSSALNTRAFVMGFGASLSYWVEDYQDVIGRAQAQLTLTTEHDLQMHRSISLMFLGFGRIHHDNVDASSVIREGLESYQRSGAKWSLAFWLASLAGSLPETNEERVAILDAAFEAVESSQERYNEAELNRLKGDFSVSGQSGNPRLAEDHYLTAKRIAREQGSMLHDIRASTSLAMLWRDQGRVVEAREMLSPVFNWFTQGLNLPVLKRAKTVLGQLG